MLAALGGVSSVYHFVKMMEWRAFEQHRINEANKLLEQYHLSAYGGRGDAAGAPGPGGRSPAPPHGASSDAPGRNMPHVPPGGF